MYLPLRLVNMMKVMKVIKSSIESYAKRNNVIQCRQQDKNKYNNKEINNYKPGLHIHVRIIVK